MFNDPVFTNAFVADGIVPDPPGFRTLVEFRSRLYSVPPEDRVLHPPSADHMDIITPTHDQSNHLHRPNALYTNPSDSPQSPNPEQGERALRTLAKSIDLSAMGSLNPSMYAIMRVAPPSYVRNCALAIQRAEDSSQQTTGYLQFIINTFCNLILAGDWKRQTEPSLLSWHWADNLLAIISGHELERLFAYQLDRNEWQLSGDRHQALFDMRAIAFRPFAGRAIAVASRGGVVLLNSQQLDTLSHHGHTHIHSLDWSPDGQFVASASANDRSVRIWDIATRLSMRLCPGSLVRFCPDKDRKILFVADAAGINFKLWDCRSWSCERWGSLSGPVVAASWSADGSTLLFSTHGQSCVHVLTVSGGGEKGIESSITHVEMTSLPREGPGGTPIHLELDATGERLAVVFEVPPDENSQIEQNANLKEDSKRRFCISLYATQLRPSFAMTPIGYITGPDSCGPPVGVKFKPMAEGRSGALLACMWRSGEISFTHLFFNAAR